MLSNLKLAIRSLLKTPSLTVVIVFTLALGIGANTAIFSIVKAVFLNPVPYPKPHELVFLWETGSNIEMAAISWPDLQDWRKDNRTFSAIGGFRHERYGFTDARGTRQLLGVQANADLFKAWQSQPVLGRMFAENEDKPGAPGLVLLSHTLWHRYFDASPAVIGRTMDLSGEVYTIVGVLRPEDELRHPGVELWTQLGRHSDTPGMQARDNHPGIFAIGRLKSGVTVEQAMADLSRISARIQKDYPGLTFKATAAGDLYIEKAVEAFDSLWLLQGAVGLVLLIACANIASLLMARGAARDSEFAVRVALGAARHQLIRQLMLESVLLAFLGGVLGLIMAHWIQAGIVALEPPGTWMFEKSSMDVGVLAITSALVAVTALLFGLWPAWKFSRPDLRSGLQASGRANSAARGARGAQGGLIVAQIALTIVLLAGAGLLLKSFMRAQSLDLGFDPSEVLSGQLQLPSQRYDSADKIRSFNERLRSRLRAMPGVESADIATSTPLNNAWQSIYQVDGKPTVDGNDRFAEVNVISDTYFRTLRIPLLRGREFGPHDTATGQRVIIIDQASAERHWPNEDALGRKLIFDGSQSRVVVGVVPTLRLYGYVRDSSYLQAYLPGNQSAFPWMNVLVRTKQEPAAMASVVRAAIAEIDSLQPISDLKPMEDTVDATLGAARLYTVLLATFAGLGLLLAAVGLYGLLAFQVAGRTREIGVRMALGAVHRHVVTLVLGDGIKLLAIGTGVGLLGVLTLGRVLQSLLYQTSPLDPVVLAGVIVLMGVIALFACWLPARRAVRVDPLVALRAE